MMSWKWQHKPYCFLPQAMDCVHCCDWSPWLKLILELTPLPQERDAFVWWWQGECQTKQRFSSWKPLKSLNVHTDLLWSADSYTSATSLEYIWIAASLLHVVWPMWSQSPRFSGIIGCEIEHSCSLAAFWPDKILFFSLKQLKSV